MNKKLIADAEEKKILSDTQARFRRSRSTIDNIYVLQHMVEKETRKRGGKVYGLFVDLRAAFDSVNREKLWEMMERKGIRRWLIRRIKEIYEEVRVAVRVGENMTREFWTTGGVRQGCILTMSPTLFSLYIVDMEERLKETLAAGVRVGGSRFCSLAYADDVVILAVSEAGMRQVMIYLEERKLTLNVAKTKMMIFGNGRGKKKKTSWRWKRKEIEVVNVFVYLGVRLQRNGQWKAHIRERVKKAQVAMREIWGIGE